MKMNKFYWSAFFCLLVFSACRSENNTAETEEVNMTFDQRAERHITGSLAIPVNEKYTVKKYKAHLNADNSEDIIFTINRLEYAIDQSSKLKNNSQIADMGYMGNYNYFVFYDGKLDKFSVPVPVASSTMAPLTIKFENIISDSYKDLTIEYRIMNASFKNYYTISGQTLHKVFQVKLFDYIGKPQPEAFYVEYGKGAISAAKDILVYEGKIKNYTSDVKDVYTYNPVIEKQNKLTYRWFYNPSTMEYMTQDPDLVK